MIRDFVVSTILDALWWFVLAFDDSDLTTNGTITTKRRRVAHYVAFHTYQFVGRTLL